MAAVDLSTPKSSDRGITSIRKQNTETATRTALIPSGLVGARIRELRSIATGENMGRLPSPSPITENRQNPRFTQGYQATRKLCSPASKYARLEVPASPPVGHAYPGLVVGGEHGAEDHGILWEYSSTGAKATSVRSKLSPARSDAL